MECPGFSEISLVAYGGLAPVSLFCSIVLCYLYFTDALLKSPPGRLVAVQILLQCFSDLHFISGIPQLNNVMKGDLCLIMGLFGLIGFYGSFNYTTLLSLELLFKLSHPAREGFVIPELIHHAIAVICSSTIIISTICIGDIGTSVIGTCSIKHGTLADLYIFFAAANALVSISVSLVAFCVHRKRYETFQFFKWHLSIILIFVVCYLPMMVVNILSYFRFENCILSTIGIFLTTSAGLGMSIVRSMDIELKSRIKRLFVCRGTADSIPEISKSNSRLPLVRMASMNYAGLFEGITQRFVLDSLLALNFLFSSIKVSARELRELVHNINVRDLFNGGYLESAGTDKMKLIEYFPSLFADIRQLEGVTDYELSYSLSPSDNSEDLNSTHQGGKSKAFLYRTYDRRFYLKTISSSEKLVLLNKLLPDYYERIRERDTMLVRILGVYTLQLLGQSSINLMIMENVLPTTQIKMKFDLKGTTVDRKVLNSSLCDLQGVVLKDLDFQVLVGSLDLDPNDRTCLLRKLQADLKLLERHRIIDYSVLLAIADDCEANASKHAYHKQSDPSTVYFLAIIDIMQPYTCLKRLENLWKTKLKCHREEEISTVDPGLYASRFLRRISDLSL